MLLKKHGTVTRKWDMTKGKMVALPIQDAAKLTKQRLLNLMIFTALYLAKNSE